MENLSSFVGDDASKLLDASKNLAGYGFDSGKDDKGGSTLTKILAAIDIGKFSS